MTRTPYTLCALTKKQSSIAKKKQSLRPVLERLEDRTVPSTLYLGHNVGGLRLLNQSNGSSSLISGSGGSGSTAGLTSRGSETSNVYAVENISDGSRFVRVNTTTGAETEYPAFNESILGVAEPFATAVAISPTNTNVAIVAGFIGDFDDPDFGDDFLWQVNVNTGAVLGAAVPSSNFSALTYSLDGSTLYGTVGSRLVTVNPVTGSTSTVGSTGLSSFIEGLAFRPEDGALFAVDAFTSDNLVRLNPNTGALVQTLGNVGIAGPEGIAFTSASASGDNTPPTVITRTPTPGTTISSATIDLDITFSEPVTGVSASDLELTGSAGGTVGVPTNVSGNTWRFPISGLVTGSLNVSLAPDANDIQDQAGNDLANLTWSYTVTITTGGGSGGTAGNKVFVIGQDGASTSGFGRSGFRFERDGTFDAKVAADSGILTTIATNGTDVFIGDFSSDEIRRYAPDGTFLGIFADSSTHAGNLNNIEFDSAGNLYATQSGSFSQPRTNLRYNSSGTLSETFSHPSLVFPDAIDADAAGNVWIANGAAVGIGDELFKFSADGTFLANYDLDGIVSNPSDMAIDESGQRLFIADEFGGSSAGVKLFDISGSSPTFVRSLATPGLSGVLGLSYDDATGNLLVADDSGAKEITTSGTVVHTYSTPDLERPADIVALSGSDEEEIITDPEFDGTTGNDVFDVFLDGDKIVVALNGTELLRQSLAPTDSLTLNGLDGNDTFRIDYTSGVIDIAININGDDQSAIPGDTLHIVGGSFATVTHTSTNGSAGTITLDPDGAGSADPSTIIYTGLEPALTETVFVDDDFANAGSSFVLDADPVLAGNQSAVIGLNAFASIQAAVDAVIDGGTVKVNSHGSNTSPSGAYNESVSVGKSLVLTGNAISGLAGDVVIDPTTGPGLTISGSTTNVTIRNLQVTDATTGIDASMATMTISNVGVSNSNIGISIGTDAIANVSASSLNQNATGIGINGTRAHAVLESNTIDDSLTGILVADGGTLELGADSATQNTIIGGERGLIVDGSASQLVDATLGATQFSGQSESFVELRNLAYFGPEFVDGSTAGFNGVAGQDLTATQLDTIGDKLHHYPDQSDVGLIFLKSDIAYRDGNTLMVIGSNDADRLISINSYRPNRTIVSGVANEVSGRRTVRTSSVFDMSGPESRIVVFALGGDDVIRLTGYLPTEVFGGAGNDSLFGGFGTDILHGQSGNDYIRGNLGNDLLIGGTGRDYLYGNAGNDVLIGGDLNTSRSFDQLLSDLTSWVTDADNLVSPSSSLDSLFTAISDDGEADVLADASGIDAFLHSENSDRVFGAIGLDDDSSWTHA